jgi:hypothetical protein
MRIRARIATIKIRPWNCMTLNINTQMSSTRPIMAISVALLSFMAARF